MGLRTTPNGVTYEELAGSPTFGATDNGLTATQKWKIDWDQVDPLTEECFPEHQAVGDDFVFKQKLKFPGKSWLTVKSLAIAPMRDVAPTWDEATGRNKYLTGGAMATLSYSSSDGEEEEEEGDGNEDIDGVLATRNITIGGELMLLPNRDISLYPSGEPVQGEDLNAGKIIPLIEQSLTINRLQSPPFDTIALKVGMVNEDATLFNAAAETLMFLGINASRDKTVAGDTAWKIEYRWSQKYTKIDAVEWAGWNHYFVPGLGWQRVVAGPDNDPIYPLTTFAELFKPDA